MRRAVFLDRDGVINRVIIRDGKPLPPANLEQLEVLPGVPEVLKNLRDAKYLLVVVTNQPDVARRTTSKLEVEKINAYLRLELPLDDIKTCYHDDDDGCSCRKPLPGMLIEAARDYDIDLSRSFMVGDRWRDIEAGHSAGCKTFFINYDYCEKQPSNPDFIVSSLLEVQQIIIGEL